MAGYRSFGRLFEGLGVVLGGFKSGLEGFRRVLGGLGGEPRTAAGGFQVPISVEVGS